MENTLRLEDKRCLAYAEYGDPHGRPLFFFHGMPGSRLFRPADAITKKMGFRLIAVDRPGYGGSDFQPGRRILDWPGDIAQLADHLAVDRFYLAGHSGGCPYVSACAFALGRRVESAAILCGPAPVDILQDRSGLSAIARFGLACGHYIPWPAWRALVRAVYGSRAADPAATIERGRGHRPAADDEQMARPKVRQACYWSEVEAFRQGLDGLAWDARLLTRPWGFPLEEIRVPVCLWHGTADREAPVAMGRRVAEKIPGCRAFFVPDEAHLLLFPHWEEILITLSNR